MSDQLPLLPKTISDLVADWERKKASAEYSDDSWWWTESHIVDPAQALIDALLKHLSSFTQPRFILHRKEGGVYHPVGRFPSITSAREHADADGRMRGRVSQPYLWGVYESGMWITYHPDYDPNKPPPKHGDEYDDYMVIDSDWSPVEPEVPTIEISEGYKPDGST